MKYKVYRNNILVVIILLIVVVLLIYFGFIKDYEKEHLLQIGYNESEIIALREELTSEDIKKIYDYNEKLIRLINEKYFILSRLNRYMTYDKEDTQLIISEVNSNLDYEYYTNIIKTDITKEKLMIVNKYYYLDNNYNYGNLISMDEKYDNQKGNKLNSEAYDNFKKLVDYAEKEGYHIRNNSGYRSYETQESLYNQYKKNGIEYADKWSARAGHSEHQTGLALDVGVAKQYATGKFENSKEFTWMKENSYKYGFILRYPKDKTHITGYGYEPWHYRYVGIEAATYIYENNLTLEEYYAYYVENK